MDEDQDAVVHRKSGSAFTGSCKVCHPNGTLEMFLTFRGGKPVGQDTVWFKSGLPHLIRSHDMEGREDGIWKMYGEVGGLRWEKNYIKGVKDGIFRYYFPGGIPEKIERWKAGKMHGIKQEFYPNGVIRKEVVYQAGKWNGRYITYFEDGTIESQQDYKKGKKEGRSMYYYASGNLFYEEGHKEGLKDGKAVRFFDKDKRKWTVETYQNGLRHGLFEEYHNNSKNLLKYRAIYEEGELVKEVSYDEFGKEINSPKIPGDKTKRKRRKEKKGAPSNP